MNRRLRVGVWILENYTSKVGGGFGYYTELIDSISKTSFVNADICFLGYHNIQDSKIGLHKYHLIKWRSRNINLLLRMMKFIGTKVFHISTIISYFEKLDQYQSQSLYHELFDICDIIYYPVPMCQFESFPFIYTLWDLCHVTGYAFPEVSGNGNFEVRKEHHDTIPLKALMVFCESEAGKNDAIKYLRINGIRIKVFPLISSGVISETLVPAKPDRIEQDWVFIHYPAQFWAHKNHYNLIAAFHSLSKKYPQIKLVLTGSDHGNKAYIDTVITENDLQDRVINLGFVTYGELKWLYLHSKGLIMPTLLGPTNMPPLEALTLGCPVAVSDLPGHREQLGGNAIYFNPLVVEEIECAIEHLIMLDSERIPCSMPTAQSNMTLLDEYFAEIKTIRHTWL